MCLGYMKCASFFFIVEEREVFSSYNRHRNLQKKKKMYPLNMFTLTKKKERDLRRRTYIIHE